MDHSFYNIFGAFDEAVVICHGESVVYANASAQALLGPKLVGRSGKELFGVLTDSDNTRSGSINTASGPCLVSAVPFNGGQLYRISGTAANDELANLADSFSAALRSAAVQQRFASDIIRQYTVGIDDPQFTDCVAIHEHSSYRIAKDAENIAFLGSGSSFFAADSSFNPMTLTKNIIESLTVFLPKRRIRLLCDAECTVFVQGDPSAFERILLNLISNAVKYSPADSTIIISLTLSGDHMRLSVRDEGRGIEPERLGSVFSAWRLPRPLSDPMAGPGLGLYVVRCLTERFGGTIMIESKPGHGTAVTVDMPIATGLTLREPGQQYISFDSRILTDLADVLPADCYKPQFLD